MNSSNMHQPCILEEKKKLPLRCHCHGGHSRSAVFTMCITSTSKPRTERYTSSTEFNNEQSIVEMNRAIGLNRKLLKMLGLWLYPDETHWQAIRSNILTFSLMIGILSMQIIPLNLALIKIWGNLTLMVDNFITNVPILTCELKLIVSWLNKAGNTDLLFVD